MVLLKSFFTADEAAQWVGRASGELMQPADIYRLVESCTLSICFSFRGKLGVFDKPAASGNLAQSVLQAVFASAKREAYFPDGYLRAAGGASLGVVRIDLRGRATKADLVNAGPVTIAQSGRGFGGLDFDPGAEMLWCLGKRGQRAIRSIHSARWLFHVDDLQKLLVAGARRTATQRAEDSGKSDHCGRGAWKALAREQGQVIIKREHERDLYPSQEAIADEIARNFRRDSIFGDGGKPLTGAYIKRHALKGVSSERRKQLSTVKHRGK